MQRERVIFLMGKRLYLRPVEEADLNRCRRWVNDPDVRQYILRQTPLDEIEEKKWHETRSRGMLPTDLTFAVVLKKGDRHIGNVGIHGIDWINRRGTTGAVIGEADCRDKGYGGEAKALILQYVFDTLGLHRITSNVLATNPRSLAYLERSGYRREGLLREHIFRNGVWVDDIQLGILASEWRAAQKRKKT